MENAEWGDRKEGEGEKGQSEKERNEGDEKREKGERHSSAPPCITSIDIK